MKFRKIIAFCMVAFIIFGFNAGINSNGASAEEDQMKDANPSRLTNITTLDAEGNITEVDGEARIVETEKNAATLRATSTKQIVNFRTKGYGVTEYTEYLTGNSGYISGAYGADAAYLGTTSSGKVKFMIGGVVGLVSKSEVQVLSLSQVEAWSYYKVSTNGNLYHYICTDMTTPGTASTLNNGTAPSYLKTGTKYYSYDGHYFYTNYNTMLSDYRNNVRANSENLKKPFYNYYQYLPFRSETAYSSTKLNSIINSNTSEDSAMRGIGSYLTSAQNTYGVNALLAASIAANESAWGESDISQTKNNLFGLNAVDSSPGTSASTYGSIKACINDFANGWMSRGFLWPDSWKYYGGFLGDKASGVNVQYASDPYWGEKAASIARILDSDGGNKDEGKYTIGIKDTIATEHTNLNTRQNANTDSSIPYQTGDASNYAVLLLNQTPSNGFYKIQSDGVLNSSRSDVVSGKGTYDFDKMYVYVSSKYIVNQKLVMTAPTVECGHRASDGKPTLSWNDVGAIEYEVYRSTSKDGTFSKMFTTSNLSYTNTSSEIGETYYYKVRAIFANGTKKDSGTYVITATCGAPEVEKGNNSNGYPTLKWQPVEGAVKYEVYRSTDGEEYIKTFTTTNTSYTNTSAEKGVTYYYKVRGITSNDKNGVYSDVVINKILEAPTVECGHRASDGKPTLSWNDVEAIEYEVYRSTDENEAFSKMFTTSNLSYTNTSSEIGKTYYYKVKAIFENGFELESTVCANTATCGAPEVEKGNNSNGYPTLKWRPVEGAAKYEVYRSTDGEEYTKTFTTANTSYTNTIAEANITYYYKVCGITSNGIDGVYSEVVTNRMLEKPIVKFSNRASDGKPTLSWNDVGANKYEVYRATSKTGTYSRMFTTSGLQYTNTSSIMGNTYYYKVRAVFENGVEVDSAVGAKAAVCGAPKVTKGNNSNGYPTLKWASVKGAAKYEVYRSTDGKKYSKTFTTTKTSYTNTSAKKGVKYYYKVRGVTSNGKLGVYSSVVTNNIK